MLEDQKHFGPGSRLIHLFALLAVVVTLLFTTLHIIGQGFMPSDDALRHVAKIFSGKEWQEILVIRLEFSLDSHPGWHAVLQAVQGMVGLDAIAMLNFSVIALFLLFVLPPAFMLRRPEAWLLALLLMVLLSFGAIFRTLYGRPMVVSMLYVLVFCYLWEHLQQRRKPWVELAVLTGLAALATWIHGTWYLLALPLVSLGVCGKWRALLLASGSTALGVMLGGLFTGQPIAMLRHMVFQVMEVMGRHDFQRQLVTELQPFDGAAYILFLVAGMLLWRGVRGDWDKSCVVNPVFALAALGWVLGFVAARFWSDWGWVALTFWLAYELQRVLEKYAPAWDLKRAGMVAAICLVFFLALGNDRGSRWSGSTLAKWPEMENPEHRPWLPDPGGLAYNDNMGLFYAVFFHNPLAPWRYTLGFEPVWMPEEDLAIYRHIQLTRGRSDSYLPWVEKMTKADRMLLVRHGQPDIEGLEWYEVTPTVWSGRLPNEERVEEELRP